MRTTHRTVMIKKRIRSLEFRLLNPFFLSLQLRIKKSHVELSEFFSYKKWFKMVSASVIKVFPNRNFFQFRLV